MTDTLYLAADLGASSGRVVAGRYNGTTLTLESLNRFANTPTEIGGHLHWNVQALLTGIREGLAKGAALEAPIASVGVDTWGVDYALLDRDGRLLGLPYMYRDTRTQGLCEAFCAHFGRRALYDRTGIQFMDINTLFQLHAEARQADSLLPKAHRLLMTPDLMNYWLCGEQANETTIASTGQMLDLATRSWALDILEAAGVPGRLFGALVPAGTVLAPVRGVPGVTAPVVAVGSHDTASAVASVPAQGDDRWAFLATGTWALMGVECERPMLSDRTYDWSYTHEGGVGGSLRFLKNITGMWIVQELRRAWETEGRRLDFDTLMRAAEASEPFASLIDPDDPPFATLGDMPAKIAAYCRRTGQTVPQTQGAFIRAAFEGTVLRYREVWQQLEQATGVTRNRLHMIGGATKDPLHCQMTADALNVPVLCGPVEGAATGNILAQMVATGALSSWAEARALVCRSITLDRYEPRQPAPWTDAFEHWKTLRKRARVEPA